MSQKIDLKNLDFNDIGNWPQKAKIVFCSLLAWSSCSLRGCC